MTVKETNSNYRFSSNKTNVKKVLIFGDSGVGKTSLGERFAYSKSPMNYPMTIGANFLSKRIPLENGKDELHIIIDVAGQSRFEEVRRAFYIGVQKFIAVCDLTRKHTLSNIEMFWIPEILRVNSHKAQINIQLIGNKSDLEDLVVITEKDMNSMADKINKIYPNISMIMPCLAVSAKENLLIDETFGIKRENDLPKTKSSYLRFLQKFNPKNKNNFSKDKEQVLF